ncbi:NAD(P)H-dependent oxidoreductase [Mycobacterium sp. 21AC1]|uniref:NAD(P)H-dependent oxidoreductase n=1 Tax=[Mycobacterium] appelbergii TaxID=2939269 RepID=UPI0029390A66|nr:NAD(P)H-dependent oxidoreductase [Mycobacterium sp. 21AC1]MDV3129120.1 NAD(P)H-dependent oxidoreductase [Mycobacterium sp. 21AC1]
MTRFLWVSAHPDRKSLTAALRQAGIEHLRRRGHQIAESDLYAMGWNPVLSDADFTEPDADVALSERQRIATTDGTLAADIRAEQDKIRHAEVVVLQFPLWWYGPPAILKGWFDRVFTNGFAFWIRDPQTGRVLKYGDGGLAGRRVLIVLTAGDRPSALGPRGISGPVEDVLWPILHGTVHYTGMAPLRPHLIASADRMDSDCLAAETACLTDRLDAVLDEDPIPYRTLIGGEYDDESRLVDELAPGATGLGIHRRNPQPSR